MQDFIANPMEARDRATNLSHVRELYTLIDTLQSQVSTLQTQVIDMSNIETTATVVPMTNFIDNSDFVFSHKDYSSATDNTCNYILARWFGRAQSVTDKYTINTETTESAYSVRASGGTDTISKTFAASKVTVADDKIEITSHGFSENDAVKFTTTGALPRYNTGSGYTRLVAGTTYYVVSVETNFFKVSLTSGGSALNFDNEDIYDIDPPYDYLYTIEGSGTGTHTVTKDISLTLRSGVKWDTDSGCMATSGGYVVSNRLSSKYAFLGNTIYFKMIIAHKPITLSITASTGVDLTNNKFTATSHGLIDGTSVTFSSDQNNLPTYLDGATTVPFERYATYYVVNSATNDFKLAKTSGGTALDLNGTGSGTLTIKTKIKNGLRCKASIWQNGNGTVSPAITQGICKGDKPVFTLSKVGTHTSGSTERQYILEVQLPDGRRFYSATTSLPADNKISSTVSTATVDSSNYVSVNWAKIAGASRYNVYRSSDSGTTWYLIGTLPASSNNLLDYGGGNITFTPPVTFTTEQSDEQKAECIITDVTDVLDGTELVAHEVNGSILFPTIINNFADIGDQFLQIEFLKGDSDTATTLADIPQYTLLLDKISLSYVYGRWHPSSRDQSLLPFKTVPTAPVISGGNGDGTGTVPTGGGGGTTGDSTGSRCVHELTNILVWSDDGNHFWMPAKSIVLGDRLVSWDGEELAPSKVRRIVNGISKMNYRIYADDNELVCSFSHRLIENMDDFPHGTNVGKLDKTIVVYKDGDIFETALQGVESFASPMKVITFKMESGKENYVSNGILSHNAKSEYDPTPQV